MVWGLDLIRWGEWGFLNRFLHLRRSRAILFSSLGFGGGVVVSASVVLVVVGLVIVVVGVDCSARVVVGIKYHSGSIPLYNIINLRYTISLLCIQV